MRLAAAVQVVLADQWLADQARDGRRALGMMRPLFQKHATKACLDLEDFGIDTSALMRLSARQVDVERDNPTFDDAAEPTARMLESLFGQIAELPTSSLTVVDTRLRISERLRELGRHLGVAIYALDALNDLESDLRNGQFNPCLDREGRISPNAVRELSSALSSALVRISTCVDEIPWRRHRDIVDNVLCGRFTATCQRALAQVSLECETWEQSPPKRRSWPIRLAMSLFALLIAVWGIVSRVGSSFVRRPRRLVRCDVHERRERVDETCRPAPVLALSVIGDGGDGGSPSPVEPKDEHEHNSGTDPVDDAPGVDPTPPEDSQRTRRRRRRRRRQGRQRNNNNNDGGCLSYFDDILCCSCELGCCEGVCCEGDCCECESCCDCDCST